jgi:drug/metabolite transporter (DMT)-like permease
MSVIWGVPYLLIRVAVRGLDPSVVVFGRTLVGAAVLLPFAIKAGVLRATFAHWRWVAVFAVIEIGIPWLLLGNAEQRLPSALTGMLIAVVPIIGALIGHFGPAREGLDRMRVAGLVAGLAGVALLLGFDVDSHGVTVFALAEVLIVAVCYALGPAIVAWRLVGVPAIGINTVAIAGVCVVYAVPALLQLPSKPPAAAAIWSVVALGLVCTALAFVVFFALIREIGPSRATVITYVNPVVALALGVLVLGEQVTVGMAVGFPLILIGSIFATRKHAASADAERGGESRSELRSESRSEAPASPLRTSDGRELSAPGGASAPTADQRTRGS